MSDNMNVHFSSNSDDWETPQSFFDQLNRIYHFEVDVCASHHNAKCNNYIIEEYDGLSQDWYNWKSCWLNPPYGRQIGKWVKKAYEESLKGTTVVCLLPARTDTAWFHDYCVKGIVRFVRGRLKFNNHENAAPFPSMVVVFEPPGSNLV
jgi:phage N-6-adenine-methyltransferase